MCLNFYRPVEVSGLLILDDDDDDEAAGGAGEGGDGGKVLSACAAAAAGDVEKSSDSAFSRYKLGSKIRMVESSRCLRCGMFHCSSSPTAAGSVGTQ